MLLTLLDGEDATDDTLTTCKTGESEEDHELEAVAKHFGKELSEITLEALIKLEQKEEGENEKLGDDDVPKRDAPSLASILGRMPSAATLGLNESISNCISNEKENGECSQMFNFICFICLHQINCLISRVGQPYLELLSKKLNKLNQKFRGYDADCQFLRQYNQISLQERTLNSHF